MAGSTPNLGLYLPGGGSTGTWTPDEVADIDPLNQNFQKIDAFAGTVGVQTSRNQQFYGPASAISSVTGMKLGDEYQESDSNKILWKYDGSNWVTSEGGLYVIRPTSANRGTINPDGSVSISSGAGSWSELLGVFSARYLNYKILFELTGAGGGIVMLRMMQGAVQLMGASDYTNSGFHITSTPTLVPFYNVSNFGQVSSLTNTGAFGEININSPSDATKLTAIQVASTQGGVYNATAVSRGAATPEDGIAFTRNGSAILGRVKVYGYA